MKKKIDDELEECEIDVREQLKKGHNRMDDFEHNLKNIERKIDIVLEFHDSFAGFFRVMSWIGKAAVWSTKVGVFLGAAWLVIKDQIK